MKLLIFVLAVALLLYWVYFKTRKNLLDRNFYYSDPHIDAREIFETIKENKSAIEDMRDFQKISAAMALNREEFVSWLGMLAKEQEDMSSLYRRLILKVRQFLIYTICTLEHNDSKANREELKQEFKRMSAPVLRANDMINEKLAFDKRAETFYLQQTLLRYFDDFDKIKRTL